MSQTKCLFSVGNITFQLLEASESASCLLISGPQEDWVRFAKNISKALDKPESIGYALASNLKIKQYTERPDESHTTFHHPV